MELPIDQQLSGLTYTSEQTHTLLQQLCERNKSLTAQLACVEECYREHLPDVLRRLEVLEGWAQLVREQPTYNPAYTIAENILMAFTAAASGIALAHQVANANNLPKMRRAAQTYLASASKPSTSD